MGYTVLTPYRLAPGKGGYKIWQALFLSDDGYSGTNFDRPAWKKIVEMIEDGEVETLIVKDLSRLGREYLQVGQLTELYFPEKGVRFIAVNDGVDSLVESSNDFNPIRNWAKRGERSGSKPPYGYKKKDKDSKEIVPDEVTAPVVCRMFELCAAGKGPNQIARILTREQILNPTNQYYQETGKNCNHLDCNHLDTTRPYSWSGKTVANILENIVYLGHTLSLQRTTLSYKNKKQIRRPESEQILVKNTHAPLISQELWDIVRDVRAHKRRPPKHMEEPNLFSGAPTADSTWCSAGRRRCGRISTTSGAPPTASGGRMPARLIRSKRWI